MLIALLMCDLILEPAFCLSTVVFYLWTDLSLSLVVDLLFLLVLAFLSFYLLVVRVRYHSSSVIFSNMDF